MAPNGLQAIVQCCTVAGIAVKRLSSNGNIIPALSGNYITEYWQQHRNWDSVSWGYINSRHANKLCSLGKNSLLSLLFPINWYSFRVLLLKGFPTVDRRQSPPVAAVLSLLIFFLISWIFWYPLELVLCNFVHTFANSTVQQLNCINYEDEDIIIILFNGSAIRDEEQATLKEDTSTAGIMMPAAVG